MFSQELSLALGECLFAGDVGIYLREIIGQGEASALFLRTDEDQAKWPWELSTDGVTGIRPALDVGLIRHWGDAQSNKGAQPLRCS